MEALIGIVLGILLTIVIALQLVAVIILKNFRNEKDGRNDD